MIPKSGNRFPAFTKPASAGEGRSEKIMLKQKASMLSSKLGEEIIGYQESSTDVNFSCLPGRRA